MKYLFFLACIVLCHKANAKTCPKGFTPEGNLCYMFNNQKKTWANAKFSCINKKSDLAQPRTAGEWNNLLTHIIAPRNRNAWLGGYEHPWRFWLWSAPGVFFTYTNWTRGAPSNKFPGNMPPCLMYDRRQNGWKDVYCGTRQPFVCEIR